MTISTVESSIKFGLAFNPRLMHPDKSAWVGHLSFAASLMHALRPRQVVELGTHWGDSFFAFCQAASELKLDCQCHAVDTWHGDVQTGTYGEEVYQLVEEHSKKYYPSISKLVRKLFDEAAGDYGEGSIDLLHIDGCHTYDLVKHDFESWRPKVRPGGVILFHDIAVRHDDFGVWKLWEEINEQYPECFSFSHCYGLGILRQPGYQGEIPFLKKLFEGRNDLELGDYLRAVFDQASDLKIINKTLADKEKSGSALAQYNLMEIQGDVFHHYNRLSRNAEALFTLMETQVRRLAKVPVEQKKQFEKFRIELSRKDTEISKIAGNLADAESKMTRLVETETRQQEQIEQLQVVIGRRDEEIRSVVGKLGAAESKATKLEEAVSHREEQIGQLRLTIERQNTEIRQINDELIEQRACLQKRDELISEIQRRYARISSLTSRLKADPIKQKMGLSCLKKLISPPYKQHSLELQGAASCKLEASLATNDVVEEIKGTLFLSKELKPLAVRLRYKRRIWPGSCVLSQPDGRELSFSIPCAINAKICLPAYFECLTWNGQWCLFHYMDAILPTITK